MISFEMTLDWSSSSGTDVFFPPPLTCDAVVLHFDGYLVVSC
jgi:hypothetical protein